MPQPKNSSVSRIDEDDDIEAEEGKTGFEDCTVDLVESQATKGIVVKNIVDGETEILDFEDIAQPIHFETELDDPEFDAFFEQCGMCKTLCIWG